MVTNKTKNGWLSRVVGNIKNTPAYLKSKIYNKHDEDTSKMLRIHGLSGGIIGEKNYNALYNQVKQRLQKGDQIGAYGFVKKNAEKLKRQTY